MRFKIDWASLYWEGNLPFLLCFTLYSRANSKYKPPWGLIFGGFFALRFWGAYIWGGLIHGGAYFRNFTVFVEDIGDLMLCNNKLKGALSRGYCCFRSILS